MEQARKRRIAFAYYLSGNAKADKDELRVFGEKIPPEDYVEGMAGYIYCPGCFTHLVRTPLHKEISTNGREPFYRHLPKYRDVACALRSKRAQGKRYDTWEEAKQAIENGELAIISAFLKDKPVVDTALPPNDYDETPVVDQEGPLAEVPLGRHTGETFALPSKISTVGGICRKFDENLAKYFFLPGAQHAVRLSELLVNTNEVHLDELDTPVDQRKHRLYYGKITSSSSKGHEHSVRMTRLGHHESAPDFTLKAPEWMCREKGITNESVGRIVMVYGRITVNGVGLAISKPAWGEFALLPKKYNDLLIPEL